MSDSISTGTHLPAGSSSRDEPAFLVIGKLRHAHGLRGEILMEVLTDFPDRLKKGSQLYLEPDFVVHSIHSIRNHAKGMLVGFEGIDTPEIARQYRNRLAFVRVSDQPSLPEGDYYHHQLIGLDVLTEDGIELGNVTGILATGANDILEIRGTSGKDILLPYTESVVKNIDLQNMILRVHLIPGLIED